MTDKKRRREKILHLSFFVFSAATTCPLPLILPFIRRMEMKINWDKTEEVLVPDIWIEIRHLVVLVRKRKNEKVDHPIF